MTPRRAARPDVKPLPSARRAWRARRSRRSSLSLAIGPVGLRLGLTGEAGALIFREIRLPRAVLGALVGGALGLSGAALQGYLRNPLAEPSLVGVSGGAALGRGAGDPSGPVAGVRAGAAARRAGRRRRRHAGGGGAGRRARRAGDADPGRARRLEHRHGADLAGPQPVAEPVRRGRDGVLDDGLARRPQPDAGVAGGAADRWSASALLLARRPRARCADAGRGRGARASASTLRARASPWSPARR